MDSTGDTRVRSLQRRVVMASAGDSRPSVQLLHAWSLLQRLAIYDADLPAGADNIGPRLHRSLVWIELRLLLRRGQYSFYLVSGAQSATADGVSNPSTADICASGWKDAELGHGYFSTRRPRKLREHGGFILATELVFG